MKYGVIVETISAAALAAGLPEGRVIDRTVGDNITLKRPRLELQVLKERFTRTGRKLGIRRESGEKVRKRELYDVELPVAAQVYAEDQEWLDAFADAFAAAFPPGVNDEKGNWLKIRVQEAELQRPADTRLGNKVIQAFKKIDKLFTVAFTWRVTEEERVAWIRETTINVSMGAHHGDEKEN